MKCPVILFHGTKDEIIPYEQSLRLKDILKPEDELITIEGGGHNNLPSSQKYNEGLKKDFKKVIFYA